MRDFKSTQLQIDDVEDLDRVFDGRDTHSVPLGRGAPCGSVLLASTGDVLLTSVDLRGEYRTQGSAIGPRVVLSVMFQSASTLFSFRSAKAVLPGDVYALAPGDDVNFRASGHMGYAFISLSTDCLMKFGGEDALRGDTAFWEQDRWFCAPPRVRSSISRSVQRIVRCVQQGNRPMTAESRHQFKQELVDQFLLGFMFDERRPRERHALSSSMIVRRAEDWLDGQLPIAIQIADMCRTLHVSRRTLHRAFKETLGIGPARYLTLKRLIAVRAELRGSDTSGITVTEIAAKYGFWELGRFAWDYRRVFGERPSETLAKGPASAEHDSKELRLAQFA